ncbi:MAG: murein biosynthesis integral membrane protein MurJ [Sandaracinaceae bacterium]
MTEAPEHAAGPAPAGGEVPEGGGTLARRAGVVGLGILTSRVLGLARDMVFAARFDAAATDLFFVAFTIPNALRQILGEGAVSSAVVPVFSEVRARDGLDEARRFHARITAVLGLVLVAVSGLGALAAPGLALLYGAGYLSAPARFATLVELTRVLFPYLAFVGLAALGMGGLNALRRFAVPAFAPALLNVALIAAAFVGIAPALALGLPPVGALALGALVGGALQVLVQVPALRAAGLARAPRRPLWDRRVAQVFRLMVPLLAGLGIYQVNVMLGRLLASFLPAGAQTYLYYTQRLVEVPQGMFALAIAAAALPTLSDLSQRGDAAEVRRVFREALGLVLFLAVPSTAVLMVLAEPIVTVLLARGAFDRAEALATAHALVVQAAGVWAIASVRVVVPMFQAHQDTRSPVVASGVNLVVFLVVALTAMRSLAHVGIALAISCAGVAQLGALLGLLRRRVGPLGLRPLLGRGVRLALASAALGGAQWAIARLGRWEAGGNAPWNIAVLVLALVVGGAVFLLLAWLLRVPELGTLARGLRRPGRGSRASGR